MSWGGHNENVISFSTVGFNDAGELWLNRYESRDFKQSVAKIWNDVKDLYGKLYGYVRYHLRQKYPQEFKLDDDPIPAHILGRKMFNKS